MTNNRAIPTGEVIDMINKNKQVKKKIPRSMGIAVVNEYMKNVYEILATGQQIDTPKFCTWSIRAYPRTAMHFNKTIAIEEGRTEYITPMDLDYIYKVHLDFEDKAPAGTDGYEFYSSSIAFRPVASKIKQKKITYPVFQ